MKTDWSWWQQRDEVCYNINFFVSSIKMLQRRYMHHWEMKSEDNFNCETNVKMHESTFNNSDDSLQTFLNWIIMLSLIFLNFKWTIKRWEWLIIIHSFKQVPRIIYKIDNWGWCVKLCATMISIFNLWQSFVV